jgi:hypothetical protein
LELTEYAKRERLEINIGLIVHNGETFEAVQRVSKDRAKPRKSEKRHDFPLLDF